MSRSFLWRRPVLKFGTSTLTAGTTQLSLAKLADLVEQVATLRNAGLQPIVVSSGAIAAGRQRLNYPRERKNVSLKQVLAAVGQSRLMHLYDQFFEFHGITSAQVLLTRSDLAERQRYLNARNTLLGLCEQGVVPIVNENDVVASDEIKVGDNDTLSALVANLIDADLLVLVTDIPGLYTADPAAEGDAVLLSEIRAITPEVEAYAGTRPSQLGTGGMAAKLAAAKLATASGSEVRIVDGRERDVLLRVLGGELLGTRFLPRTNPIEGRKRWILSGATQAAPRGSPNQAQRDTQRVPAGSPNQAQRAPPGYPAGGVPDPGQLIVDAGAARALLGKGASLLPAGIVAAHGTFERGDTVDILAGEGPAPGTRIACGITNYAAGDVQKILRRQSSEIEGALGYSYGDYVVHRDDLVCFTPHESHPEFLPGGYPHHA